jgi:hypothetical protein
MTIGQASATALVSPGFPHRIDHALAIAEHAAVAVRAIVRGAASCRQTKCLDMSTGKSDGEKRLARVERGGEDVGLERQGAEVFEHGGVYSEELCQQKTFSEGSDDAPDRAEDLRREPAEGRDPREQEEFVPHVLPEVCWRVCVL